MPDKKGGTVDFRGTIQRAGVHVLVVEKPLVSDGSSAGTVGGPATPELRFSDCGMISFAFSAEAGLVGLIVEIGSFLIIYATVSLSFAFVQYGNSTQFATAC